MKQNANLILHSLLATQTLAATDTFAPLVRWIQPHQGGSNGGTEITINGWSFSTNAGGPFGGEGNDLGNYVVFVNEAKEYECPVFNNDANDEVITCTTMPMPEGEYHVRIKVDGNWMPDDQLCGGYANSWNCRFNVQGGNTPFIQSITPDSGSPGEIIDIRGTLFIDMFESLNPSAYATETGRTCRIKKPFNAGASASFFKAQDDPYGVTMDSFTSDWGNLKMKLGGNYIGYQNVSFMVSEDYGRSKSMASATKLSPTGRLHMFESHATVNTVAPSTGGELGGTLITITGEYFDETITGELDIKIGGLDCQVVTASMTEITCLTPMESTDAEFYQGNRGVYAEQKSDSGVTLDNIFDETGFSQVSGTDGKFEWSTGSSSTANRLSSYITLPGSGRYVFGSTVSDKTVIRVDGNEVFRSESSSDSIKWSETEIELNAGEAILLEAGVIGSSVKIALRLLDTDFLSGQIDYNQNGQEYSVSESKHRFQIMADNLPETQSITFNNFDAVTSIDNSNADPQVVSICVVCNSTLVESGMCPSFSMSHFGYSSSSVYYGANSEIFEQSLSLLPFYNGSSIEVRNTTGSCDFEYILSTDNFFEQVLAVEENGLEVDDNGDLLVGQLTMSVTVSDQGSFVPNSAIPQLSGLAISSFERIDASSIQAGLTDLTSAFCPDELTHWNEDSASLLWFDYEDFGNDQSTAFCGKKSYKNLGWFYSDDEGGFNALFEQNICFAFKGGLTHLYISYTYRDSQNMPEERADNFRMDLPDSGDDEWHWHCDNLIDLMETVIGSLATSQRIVGLAFTGSDYNIDNVFVSRTRDSTDDEINEILKQRVESPAPSTDSVSVTDNSGSFQVVFNPIDCAIGYDLVSFVGMDEISDNGNTATYRHSSWPSGSSIEVTRDVAATPPLEGSFSLDYASRNTQLFDIPANVTQSELEAIMIQIDGVGEVDVSVKTDLCYERKWHVKFRRSGGHVNYPTFDVSGLIGQNPVSGDNVPYSNGGLTVEPIPSSWCKKASKTPVVEVTVNQVPSVCSDCSFSFTSVSHSVSSASSELVTGNVVSVMGAGFSANSEIYVDGKSVETTYASENELEFTVSQVSDSNEIKVLDESAGGFSNSIIVNGLAVSDSVSRTTASFGGSTTITISGSGFTELTIASLSGVSCSIESFHYSEIVVSTAAAVDMNAPTGNLIVSNSRNEVIGNFEITFDSDITPVVDSQSVPVSAISGSEVTFYGSSLQGIQRATVGGETAEIVSVNTTEVTIQSPSMNTGVYSVILHGIEGAAFSENSLELSYDLYVTSMSPSNPEISALGGTKVTITGAGFEEGNTKVEVNGKCSEIVSVTSNEVVFKPASSAVVHSVDNSGEHADFGEGFEWNMNVIEATVGDKIDFSWDFEGMVIAGLNARIYETLAPTSTVHKENGFKSAESGTDRGVYTLELNEAGTYYFSSDCVDLACVITMRGTIVVAELPSGVTTSGGVNVFVSGQEASLTSSGRRKRDTDFQITYNTDLTAVVTEISTSGDGLNAYYLNQDFIVTGENFGTDAIIKIAGSECYEHTSDSSSISCQIDTMEGGPAIGVYQAVTVEFSTGAALIKIQNIFDRQVVPLPTVYVVNPSGNEIYQKAHLAIEGAGFDENAVILIDGNSCPVISSTYEEIVCDVPDLSTGSWSGNVLVYQPNAAGQNIEAKCPEDDETACEISYSPAGSVQQVSTNNDDDMVHGVDNVISFRISGLPVYNIIDCEEWTTEETHYNPVTCPECVQDSSKSCIRIFVGAEKCELASISGEDVSCNISSPPSVGEHDVVIISEASGKVSGSISVQSKAVLDSVNPVAGSVWGGQTLVLTGSGFGDDVVIEIGDNNCVIASVSATEITCVTGSNSGSHEVTEVIMTVNSIEFPAVAYTYDLAMSPSVDSIEVVSESSGDDRKKRSVSLSASGGYGDSLFLAGTGFSSDAQVSIGGVSCDILSATITDIECTLGAQTAGTFNIIVSIPGVGSANLDAQFEYVLELNGISPASGSFAGGQSLTITGSGFNEETTSFYVCDELVSLVGNMSANMAVIETLEKEYNGSNEACQVKVVDGSQTRLLDSYNYDDAVTPQINSMEPVRGGTAGGTFVTITGSGFTLAGDALTDVTVTFGGVACDVLSVSETEIECQTNAIPLSGKYVPVVKIGDFGSAKSNSESINFYFVDRWSSIWSWGGTYVPVDGEMVIVPAGQTIVIDCETAILKLLLIDGGKVMFDDETLPVLQAEQILITNGGILEIGTAENPYMGEKATITLHGHPRQLELPVFGTKVLGVYDGSLEMHGRVVDVPWTKLENTASVGDTHITVQTPLGDWRAGDSFLIASTGDRNGQNENEERIVSSISEDGLTVHFDEPLDWEHYGYTETLHNGQFLEMRAEIGLLTRNILFQGNNNPQWNDVIEACPDGFNVDEHAIQTCFQGRFGEETGTDEYGAHIMIHPKDIDSGLAVAHIENVELFYVGQAYRIGRYPMHWHRLGDATGNYFRSSVIHKAFNRGLVMHNTHNSLNEFNVIFDCMGGCVFIEDGLETGNIIQNNLISFVKSSHSLINDDVTPASMWITNANNIIQNNAIAGSTHFGYWYRMNSHPDGASYDENICQQKVPLGVFQNNTAHTCGWFGLWTFEHFYPKGDGDNSCWSGQNTPAVFKDSQFWRCNKGVEFFDVGAVGAENIIVADNKEAGIEYKRIYGTKWGADEGAYLRNITIVASTPTNPLNVEEVGLVFPDSSGLIVDGVDFCGWDQRGQAIRGAFIVCICQGNCGGFEVRFKNVRWFSESNTHRKINWRWANEAIVRDLDGSFLGMGEDMKIVKKNDFHVMDGCTELETTTELRNGPHAFCPASVSFHRMSFNEPQPTSAAGVKLSVITPGGNGTMPFSEIRLAHAGGWMGVMRGEGIVHELEFEGYRGYTNMSYSGLVYDLAPQDGLVIQHIVNKKPDSVKFSGTDYPMIDHFPTLGGDNNYDWFYNETNRMFSFLIKNDDAKGRKRRAGGLGATADNNYKNIAINPLLVRCFHEDCQTPPDPSTFPPTMTRPERWDLLSVIEWEDVDDADWGMAFKKPNGPRTGARKKRSAVQPITGDNLLIDTEMWMVWDDNGEDLPVFDTIIIKGVIEIEATNVKLRARNIIVSGGRIIVGWNETSYFDGDLFEIVLHGSKNDEEAMLADGVPLGNKALGCFGGCDFHGRPRAVTQTKLTSSVSAGDTVISLEQIGDIVAGDELMVTASFHDATESETVMVSSVTGNDVTLTSGLSFAHQVSAEIECEVSVLSRNIRIRGAYTNETWDDCSPALEEPFIGGRVLVGQTQFGFPYSAATGYNGYGRFNSVQFSYMGQYNMYEEADPRYALAFLQAGNVDDVMPSQVANCAIHDGFGAGLGVFHTNALEITGNTIHKTLHYGMKLVGQNLVVEDNLVTFAIDRALLMSEEVKFEFSMAAVDINGPGDAIVFNRNTVIGSDRACIRTWGQPCSTATDDRWVGNKVRTCTIGVLTDSQTIEGPSEEPSNCQLFANYKISRTEVGIIMHGSNARQVHDCLIQDSKVGFYSFTLNSGSTALNTNVIDTTIIGYTTDYDCTTRGDLSELMQDALGSGTRVSADGGGFLHTGHMAILMPNVGKKENCAPADAPYNSDGKWPSHQAEFNFESLTIKDFTNQCGEDAMISHNPSWKSSNYPVHFRNTVKINSDNAVITFVPRPDIGSITVADGGCIDMECDGRKQWIITDHDGGLLGQAGTIIPQKEFGWDDPNESPRGLGDYRIPKQALTDPFTGDRISTDDYCPKKGLVRTDSCVQDDTAQVHICYGATDYLQVEFDSGDHDSITRRIGPLALVSETGYVDLYNGPSKQNWGERLSRYQTNVKGGLHYDVWFTATPPQTTRIRAFSNDENVRLAVWFPHPQRMDVYKVDKTTGERTYVQAENMDLMDDGVLMPRVPTFREEYIPAIGSPHGNNYQIRDEQLLFITLTGEEEMLELKTAPVVLMSFGFPPVDIDDFFEENLIANLMAFFGLPPSKVRIVNIVRENSVRKRRSVFGGGLRMLMRQAPVQSGEVTIEVEIGDAPGSLVVDPDATTDENLSDMTIDDVNQVAADAVTAYQSGALSSAVTNNLPVDSIAALGATQAVPMAGTEAFNVTVAEVDQQLFSNGSVSTIEVAFSMPDYMEIEWPQTVFDESAPFAQQPRVRFIGDNGLQMMTLGMNSSASQTWQMSASLEDDSSSGASLAGSTTVDFGDDGWFSFTDLQINGAIYDGAQLKFQIGPYPAASTWNITSGDFYVKEADCSNANCEFGYSTCDINGCYCLDAPDQIDFKNYTSVDCSRDGITIEIDQCAIIAARMDPTEFYLAGLTEDNAVTPAIATAAATNPSNTCVGSLNDENYQLTFNTASPMYDCQTDVSIQNVNGTDRTYYSNAVQGFTGGSNAFITRQRYLKVEYSCSFPLEVQVTGAPINALLHQVSQTKSESVGAFDLAMGIYDDGTYTNLITTDMSVYVPDYIHFGAVANSVPDPRFLLKVDTCWATKSNDPSDVNIYQFMSGGCPVSDATFELGMVIPENGVDLDVTFALESFIWPDGSTTAYFHCAVELCDSQTSSCSPTCSRKKRDTHEKPHALATIASVGPITMKKPSSCKENYCSDKCKAGGWSFNPFSKKVESEPKCSCEEGYEFMPYSVSQCQLMEMFVPVEGITVIDRKVGRMSDDLKEAVEPVLGKMKASWFSTNQ